MDSFESNVTLSIIKKDKSCINIELGTVSNIDLLMGDDPRYINSVAAYFTREYPQNTEFLITLAMVEDVKLKFVRKLNVNLQNEGSIEFVLLKHLEANVYNKAKLLLGD